MNALLGIIYAMSATSAGVSAVEHAHLDQRISASQQIKVGATKPQVRALLGSPLGDWEQSGFLFGSGPPQWCYGTVFEARYILQNAAPLPLPLPLNIRLFGPGERDLVITWDKSGRVTEVKRPESGK